tara:strand:- start:192 stop:476 length:285 start_codon:yes stop_codon:yes gene_type:complete
MMSNSHGQDHIYKEWYPMPVEEIAVGVLAGIARLCAWLIIEAFLHGICWGIGWATLKAFTLGAYPKAETSLGSVIAVGIVVLLLFLFGLAIYSS